MQDDTKNAANASLGKALDALSGFEEASNTYEDLTLRMQEANARLAAALEAHEKMEARHREVMKKVRFIFVQVPASHTP